MAADYRTVLGTINGLKRGFTTGTTAQAAAKAATLALFSRKQQKKVEINLPEGNKPFSGLSMIIPVHVSTCTAAEGFASVIKDAGDDKDDTNGMEIQAQVQFSTETGVQLKGGLGIGFITRPGLKVPSGEPAINPVPTQMIKRELNQLLQDYHEALPPGQHGLTVIFTAPEGEKIAALTWNSRVGVEGGISIIGTSGAVEPRSESAYKASIGMIIKSAAKERNRLVIASGYVVDKYLKDGNFQNTAWITVGDYLGFAMKQSAKRGIHKLLLIGHIGKISKISAGLFNTHYQYGDARLETVAAFAAACGAVPEQIEKLLSLSLAEAAVPLLEEWKLEQTFYRLAERAVWRCKKLLVQIDPNIEVSVAILDLKSRMLGFAGEFETEEELCRNFM